MPGRVEIRGLTSGMFFPVNLPLPWMKTGFSSTHAGGNICPGDELKGCAASSRHSRDELREFLSAWLALETSYHRISLFVASWLLVVLPLSSSLALSVIQSVFFFLAASHGAINSKIMIPPRRTFGLSK